MPTAKKTIEADVMREISKEMDIPYSIVKDVVINGQSAFTKHVMENGGYGSVRWPGFGLFRLKHKFMLVNKHMKGLTPIVKKVFGNYIKTHGLPKRDINNKDEII